MRTIISSATKTRDNSIDILRSFALIAIILIHCHPDSNFVCQLTEFNVPMMVFLSGVSYALSSKNESYGSYCWKRFKRLILPAWIFIWGYGCVLSFLSSNFMAKFLLFNSIFYTYWFVWIIRVFFLIALLAPLFKKYINFINSSKKIATQLTLVYVCYEITLRYINTDFLLWNIFAQIIPYSIFFILGMVTVKTGGVKIHYTIQRSGLLIFTIIAFYYYSTSHQFIVTSAYKYPPQIYYSSFAIAIISILWMRRKSIERKMNGMLEGKVSTFFKYIGSHTIWIYFWHIPFVEFFTYTNSDMHYMAKFAIAMSAAFLIVFLQEQLIRNLNTTNGRIQKWLNILFIG